MRRVGDHHPAIAAHPDSGFTLVEVVIAMAVFVVLAGSVLGILLGTARTTGDNVRRTAATNLASQYIEAARNVPVTAAALPLGVQQVQAVVGKIPYTVTQNNSLATNATDSICSSTAGNSLYYVQVDVQVTWPGMENIKPIRADMVRGIGVNSSSSGYINVSAGAITVTGPSGPLAGVPVTLTPATGMAIMSTTGSDGCAVFARLPAGVYTATAAASGYVASNNTATASTTVSLTGGTVGRGALTFGLARTVSVAYDLPAGSTPAAGIPLRLGGGFIPSEYTPATCISGSTSACTTGVPGTIQNLYPAIYTVKAGACVESSPSSVQVDATNSASVIPPANVPLGAVTVKVQNLGGTAVAGHTVTFTHASQGTGCTAGETYTATIPAAATSIAIPYGTWTVSTSTLTAPVMGQITVLSTPVTISASTRTSAATLIVVS